MNITLKRYLSNLITDAVKNIALSRNINAEEAFGLKFRARVEYPPGPHMGHYSTPIAMECAKIFRRSPRDIALEIVDAIQKNADASAFFSDIKIENPGFINFYLLPSLYDEFFNRIFHDAPGIHGLIQPENNQSKIIFEFVSANPTGPLNIVSARSAAVGDAICRILKTCGYNVYREYYVNDYGNQVRLLGLSLAARYLQKLGYEVSLPEEGYQGEYIKDVLEEILKEEDVRFVDVLLDEIKKSQPADYKDRISEIFMSEIKTTGDVINIDDHLPKLSSQLGDFFGPLAVEKLRATHEKDLESFGVHFDHFFSEKSLHDNGEVLKSFEDLKKSGHVYEQEGAWLFKSTDYNDEKDRVIIRSDKRPTYLLADIAYHQSKIKRGFNQIYDIWGPDHHGYIARLKGAIKALGFPGEEKQGDTFEVMIVQQVNMIEDGKPVVMSKRLGKFHTMKDLLEKIPADVVRYFFLMRSQSSHLDFDLDLATTHSNKNPVYYIQYAHARICSIFREAGMDVDKIIDVEKIPQTEAHGFSGGFSRGFDVALVRKASREELLMMLWRYPEILEVISLNHEPHLLTEYLYELASAFTRFYHERENIIVKALETDPAEGNFLLKICQLTRTVMVDGLKQLGISAPREM